MHDVQDAVVPTFENVLEAVSRVSAHIHRTPVLTSSFINNIVEAELLFECENFQKAGAFRVRGASNAVFSLDADRLSRGVATHSRGNHALSLFYAAARRGIP